MRKFLVAVAAAGMISFASSADAQELEAPTPVPMAAPAQVVQSAPMSTRSTRSVRSNRRGGLLSGLVDLERRKNAWLRRTFLGR